MGQPANLVAEMCLQCNALKKVCVKIFGVHAMRIIEREMEKEYRSQLPLVSP